MAQPEHDWWRVPGQDVMGRDRVADVRLGDRCVLRVPPGEIITLDRQQLVYLRAVIEDVLSRMPR